MDVLRDRHTRKHIIHNFSLLNISSLLCTRRVTEDTLGVSGDANGLLVRIGGKRMEPLRPTSSVNRGVSNVPTPPTPLILRSRRPFGDSTTSPPLWHQPWVNACKLRTN